MKFWLFALMGCVLVAAQAQVAVKPAASTAAPIVAAAPLAPASAAVASVALPIVAARSFVVLDLQSGQTLAASNADLKVEPASLTKMMTAYLVFAAIKDKKLNLTQAITISQTAYQASGSRMFAEPAIPVTVEDLIKGMIIQSGNDAAIALAELVGGGEAAFADKMNQQAKKMGLASTRFTNSTGLPDPQHVTTAADMALMARALIEDFPAEYASYYGQKEFSYNRITQPNRNRLLWLDPTVDGVKTGHTDNAGFCLVASAKRPGAAGTSRRLVTVVMGTNSMDARVQESGKLLNWGFQNFETVRVAQASAPIASPEIWKGSSATVKLGFLQDIWLTVPSGQAEKIKTEVTRPQPLIAPLVKGQAIGALKILLDGKLLAEKPVYVLEDVAQAGIFGRAWDSIRLWFK